VKPSASRAFVILALATSLLVAGCQTAAVSVAPNPRAESAAEQQAAAELLRAEMQWRNAASTPANYLLAFEFHAFTHASGCKKKEFSVSPGRSKQRSESRCGGRLDTVRDVPGLFALARELITEHRGGVAVEYDPTFGYPKRFQVWRPGMEDSHFGFEVLEFTPWTAGKPQ
jgi:hypothetical protein